MVCGCSARRMCPVGKRCADACEVARDAWERAAITRAPNLPATREALDAAKRAWSNHSSGLDEGPAASVLAYVDGYARASGLTPRFPSLVVGMTPTCHGVAVRDADAAYGDVAHFSCDAAANAALAKARRTFSETFGVEWSTT